MNGKVMKLKTVKDTSIALRWKRVQDIELYLLLYKNVDAGSDWCEIFVGNASKSHRIKDLKHATNYVIKIATVSDNITELSDWMNVTTLGLSEENGRAQVYNLTFESVLIGWPYYDVDVWNVLVFDRDNIVRNVTHNTTKDSIQSNNLIISGLNPNTKYRLDISTRDSCGPYIVQLFWTAEENYAEECSPITRQPDTRLRMFTLPDRTYFITWNPQIWNLDHKTDDYVTVIRILGEPFLHPIRTHVVDKGHLHLHLNDLDISRTYLINLMMFALEDGRKPHIDQKISFIPKDGVPDMPKIPFFGTSVDEVIEGHIEAKDRDNDTYIHEIVDANFTVISKLEANPVDISPPIVSPPGQMFAVEGERLDIKCDSRGDPYPTILWRTISENDIITQCDSPNRTISITSQRYVSVDPNSGITFLGTRSFLTIDPLTHEDEGLYSCLAANPGNMTVTGFTLVVDPSPPRKVSFLQAVSPTPFKIKVTWQKPDPITGHPRGQVISYHVALADQYNFELMGINQTGTGIVFDDLIPNSWYHVYVWAYNMASLGDVARVTVSTQSIPHLSPPSDVNTVTLNATTMKISWTPPLEVQHDQIRMRGYMFHHRKYGSLDVEEMAIGRIFTNISIIGLEPERKYEVKVVSLSEDGQRSESDWVLANTSRESYMNETVPPPPPQSVFLRAEDDNIIVSWLKSDPEANILVRGYLIEVYHNKTKSEAMKVGHSESSVILYEVDMGVLYQISVKAFNNVDYSVDQWEELYIPIQYVSKESVQNFTGVALSSTQLLLHWEPPGSGLYNRFVLSYTWAGDDKPALPGGGIIPPERSEYVVRSLRPYTEYVFSITPYLRHLKGVSADATVRTLTDKPSMPPHNVSLTPINSSTIHIHGSPPLTGKNGPILEYRISYRSQRARDSFIVPADENETLNYYLTDLEPVTVYELRVRALTVNGSGPWTFWLQAKTLQREPVMPKPPRNLTTLVTSHSVTLTWLPPLQPLRDITGYLVGQGRFIPEVLRVSLTNQDISYTFENLEPSSSYILSVRTFNDFAESAAEFKIVTTLGT
ncbi:netrin receptor DCC-like isoform X2 [Mya arenaria]|nr:netrin receptor DCC-like isoform X2 [Mya arenaria]